MTDGGEAGGGYRWRRSLPVEVAQSFQVLLQILGVKLGGDPAEPEDLPEFPKGKACQLVSLAQREPALRIEMNRQLDEELVRYQARRVEDVLRDLKAGSGGGQRFLLEAPFAVGSKAGRVGAAKVATPAAYLDSGSFHGGSFLHDYDGHPEEYGHHPC